ncbi:MAG: HAMP domain-containing protein [Deltaproteobacteria bacterium]|nr:HAMP domain-containing protein [Deltaproteobacteria bacterium]
MRHSLSARIFSLLLVVVLAFGGVMGYTIYRMHQVRRHLELVNTRYLRLTLVLGELQSIQVNLLNTIAERAAGRGTSKFLRRQVRLARQYRLYNLRKAHRLIGRAETLTLPALDQKLSARSRTRLQQLLRAYRHNEARLNRLFGNEELKGEERQRIGESLLHDERRQLSTIRRLNHDLRARVKSDAVQVEADQRAGILIGALLVAMTLLIAALVAFRTHRLLHPLKVLVKSTKRIGSGDYSGRVKVASRDELSVLAGEFNKMAAALEERERRLIRSERLAVAGRLASHITHEVRNPMNSISLNTELLEEELEGLPEGSRGEARSLCRAVQHEIQRLTEITEEYLQFARLPKPQLATENINEIIGRLLDFMREEFAAGGIVVQRELDEELPKVVADENQLRQALLNLLRNAAEAMARQGGTLHVSTGPLAEGVEIHIADEGDGIASDALPQIFDPFFSTKKGGTGLGLALTQQIINEHGGAITVRSEEGEGTTFKVFLPASPVEEIER